MQYTCLHEAGHYWQHSRVQLQQECRIHPIGLHQWWCLWNWHGKVIESRDYTWYKNGRDTFIFQLLAASNFYKKAINNVYPEVHKPGVNRRVQIKSFSPVVRYTTLRTWMEWSTSCGHTHQMQIFKAGNKITLCHFSQGFYSVQRNTTTKIHRTYICRRWRVSWSWNTTLRWLTV